MIEFNIIKELQQDKENVYDKLEHLSRERKNIKVIFPSGNIKTIPIKVLIVNLFIYELLIKYDIPFDDIFITLKNDLQAKLFEKIFVQIYEQILEKYKTYDMYDKVSEDLWYIINKIMNFIMKHCTEYTKSINLIDIIKLVKDPKFREYMKLDEWKPNEWPIKETERREKQMKKKLIKYLREEDNPFRPFVRMNMLNETQLFNTLISVGFRTDIDDRIVPHYIASSFLEGLDSNIEYITESMAAKKSIFYNKTGISNARYFERIMQLISMSVRNLYPGDCGSTVTVPFLITAKNYDKIIGANIVKNNRIVTLSEETISDYIDEVVELRSPITCKYTDGTCETCAGKLSYYFPRRFNIGLLSCIQTIEPVSQGILSAKHFQQTSAVEWKSGIASLFFEYFTIKDNHIYLTKYGRDHKFLVSTDVVKNIINLPYIGFEYINENNFSPIDRILSIYTKNGKHKEGTIELRYRNIRPTFSTDFVKYFIKNKDKVITVLDDKTTMIDASKFPISKPFMTIDIFNDSMVSFVEAVEHFFNSDITKFNNVPEVLKHITDLIYLKVKSNILFVQCILKAFLVTDENNYKIPVVNDVRKVKFNNIQNINMNRALSIMLSFERHKQMLGDPNFVLEPKEPTDFDELLLYDLNESY